MNGMSDALQFLAGVSAAIALLSMLVAAALVWLLVALTRYGASQFRVKMRADKMALAYLATSTAAAGAIVGIGPLLMRMADGAHPIVTTLLSGLVLFGLPPLFYAWFLQINGDLKPNEGQAIGFFGYGAWTAVLSLVLLLVTAIFPAYSVEAVKNSIWLMLLIGGGLLFAGYSVGTKLAQRGISGSGDIKSGESTGASTTNINGGSHNPSSSDVPTQVPGAVKQPTNRFIVVGDKRYDLGEGERKIGRVQTCDVRVTGDEEVSREHAVLRITQDKCILQDMASRNGTYLNGDRVHQPRELRDGDQIRVGNSTMVYKQA
jgi:hypothetical protein